MICSTAGRWVPQVIWCGGVAVLPLQTPACLLRLVSRTTLRVCSAVALGFCWNIVCRGPKSVTWKRHCLVEASVRSLPSCMFRLSPSPRCVSSSLQAWPHRSACQPDYYSTASTSPVLRAVIQSMLSLMLKSGATCVCTSASTSSS